ncbi:MAG: N-6 DNA methylase [Vicinamibacterales bacterium]
MSLLEGTLLGRDFLHAIEGTALGDDLVRSAAVVSRVALARACAAAAHHVGPASPLRVVLERGAIPLLRALGHHVRLEDACWSADDVRFTPRAGRGSIVLVASWNADLDTRWRAAVKTAATVGAPWCLAFNGRRLRLIDAAHPYARRHMELDVDAAAASDEGLSTVAGLFGARTLAGLPSLLDRLVLASHRHATAVCGALDAGVREGALSLANAFLAHTRRRDHREHPTSPTAVFEQALTTLCRILFLLFAEARSLVPLWHPVYRHGYSVAALQDLVDARRTRGLWSTLQAMSRLAHLGCHFGRLRLVAFNGQLFEPDSAPLAEVATVPDELVRDLLLSVTTAPGVRRGTRVEGRRRIAFGDLGVEQLGAVYERVLDFSPVLETSRVDRATSRSARSRPARERLVLRSGASTRRATGTFYTPRSLTSFVVRRTLAPLVQHASPSRILQLRVLDPAMGSGAFLVAACRYLASAYEQSLWEHEGERLDESGRALARRTIAQRCLFGVDSNPMAVQLARLSLWLTTLARDQPLTFLDHHLRVGNSLVGAAFDDLMVPPRAVARRRALPAMPQLPFFDGRDMANALGRVLPVRAHLATTPDDTPQVVRSKAADLAGLARPTSPLGPWRMLADVWCGAWFGARPASIASAGVYYDVAGWCLRGSSALAADTCRDLVERGRQASSRAAAFHWPLEFPEVFFDDAGAPAADAGFDAIVGNPPWDMLRRDRDEAAQPATPDGLAEYARESGQYAARADAHVNLYQLFVERTQALVRHGGRFGLVLPWGFAADHGSGALRRRTFDTCDVDTLVSFDNRHGIFPIHRGVRFLAVAATRGRRSTTTMCRFGIDRAEALDSLPDAGLGADRAAWTTVSRDLLERLGGERLTLPDVRSARDLRLLERVTHAVPALGHEGGWHVRFGRELNATDDRRYFASAEGCDSDALPIVEGKHLSPFRVDLERQAWRLPQSAASRLLRAETSYGRARLCYRDVTSPTNRHPLIAAVLPAGVVSTHTVFCTRSTLDDESLWVLCALLNSHVANHLVRLRVSNHVTTALMHALPVPLPERSGPTWRTLASFAELLSRRDDAVTMARLQALAAVEYGLDRAEIAHVLDASPGLLDAERSAVLMEVAAFQRARLVR